MAKKVELIMDWLFDQFVYPLFEKQVNGYARRYAHALKSQDAE